HSHPDSAAHSKYYLCHRRLDSGQRRQALSISAGDPVNQLRWIALRRAMLFTAPEALIYHRARDCSIHLISKQATQRFHVRDVFTQVFAFRCFENFRDFSKSPAPHDEEECVQADLALSDVLMPVHPGAARGFGIVQMNSSETVESDYAIEFAKRSLSPGFAADVVAGGENVRGVQTNTKALRFAHALDDVSDLLEAMTKT